VVLIKASRGARLDEVAAVRLKTITARRERQKA